MIYFLRYIKFLWLSDNAHGIHSPFVYNLAIKCLLDFTDKPEYTVIDEAIAGDVSGLQQKQAKLLFRILSYLQPDEVYYEGDSNTGLFNLINILIANRNPQAYSIISATQAEARNPQSTTQNSQPANLYFIDTNKKAAALINFRKLLITKNNNTTLIFNNIYTSAEMQQAWHVIKNHQEVTVTVDIFCFGLVFFRQEQAREHFKIRIASSHLLNAGLGIRKLWGLIN